MPTEFSEWISSSAGVVVLALLSGAGGSALLELLWRPRRTRRRVATLLAIEIEQNTNMLAVYTALAADDPTAAGADFSLSTIVWDAAKDSLAELDEGDLRKVVALYGTYNELNADISRFHQLASEYDPELFKPKTLKHMMLEGELKNALHVIVDLAKEAKEMGRGVLPRLRIAAGTPSASGHLLSDEKAKEKAQARLLKLPHMN